MQLKEQQKLLGKRNRFQIYDQHIQQQQLGKLITNYNMNSSKLINSQNISQNIEKFDKKSHINQHFNSDNEQFQKLKNPHQIAQNFKLIQAQQKEFEKNLKNNQKQSSASDKISGQLTPHMQNMNAENFENNQSQKWKKKTMRQKLDLQNFHGFSKGQVNELINQCANYQEFKRKFQEIRLSYKNIDINKSQQNNITDFENKQITATNQPVQKPKVLFFNYQKLLSDINNKKEFVIENQNEETKEGINKEQETFDFNLYYEELDFVKEINIDPVFIYNKNKSLEEKKVYIEDLVNIKEFKISDENLDEIQTTINSYFNTNIDKKVRKRRQKKKKNTNVKTINLSQNSILQTQKLNDNNKNSVLYKKYPWGYIQKNQQNISVQGDITNRQLWKDFQIFKQQQNMDQKYSVILMDPAWTMTGCTLGYKTIEDEKWMNSFKIDDLMDNGFLGVWVTNKKIPDGFQYLQKNFIQFVELLSWVKVNKIYVVQNKVGFYLLHSAEYCIIGMKRRQGVLINDFAVRCKHSNFVFAETEIVSQKPKQLYQIFENMVQKGPYLELFARKHNNKEGWHKIGDEALCYKNESVENLPDYQSIF